MRRALFILIVCVTGIAGYFSYPVFLRHAFHISGTVHITPRLQEKSERPNTVLFIIAKNDANIPVAMKRVVNPVFPMRFMIGADDLILPEPWRDNLRIEVSLNDHGQVGDMRPGDMIGGLETPVYFWARNVQLTIDKMIDLPSLRSSSLSSARRGEWIFAQPSR